MRKARSEWILAAVGGTVRAMQKGATKTRGRWLEQLVCALVVMLSAISTNADAINANVAEIPAGPGQACIKYTTFYASLADWIGGMPAELVHYRYISYDAVEYWRTVHSCVGGSSLNPGPLPEGKFFLFTGNQWALVDIERIQDKCPYMLTYYMLKNPIRIPDPDGICVKGKPASTNTSNPDTGKPECPQVPMN